MGRKAGSTLRNTSPTGTLFPHEGRHSCRGSPWPWLFCRSSSRWHTRRRLPTVGRSLPRLVRPCRTVLSHGLAPCDFDIAGQSVCSPSCRTEGDRKSTRLNSSHLGISYAVFCLKQKI